MFAHLLCAEFLFPSYGESRPFAFFPGIEARMRGSGHPVGFGGWRGATALAFLPQSLVIKAGHPAMQSWVHSSAVRGSVRGRMVARGVSPLKGPRGWRVGIGGYELGTWLASRWERAVGLSVRGWRWRFADEGPPLVLRHTILVRADSVRFFKRGFPFALSSGIRCGRPLCFPETQLLFVGADGWVLGPTEARLSGGPTWAWLSGGPTEFRREFRRWGCWLAAPRVLGLTVSLAGGGTLWVCLLAWSVGRVEGSLEGSRVVTSSFLFGMLGNGGRRGRNGCRLGWGALGVRIWCLRYFSASRRGIRGREMKHLLSHAVQRVNAQLCQTETG